ncbi:MAG TPA: NAD(P)H-dependent oxidoreductase, partial [Ktedonobacteraceae bacterium]
ELPTYDAQLAADEPAAVRTFKAQLRAAHAVLIATPEYKGMLSRSLRNALAWIAHSDESALVAGKSVAIMGIGRQTSSERQHLILRQFLMHLGASIVGTPEVYVTAGWEKVDDEGNVTDGATHQQIRALVTSLAAQAREQEAVLIS